MEEYDNPPEEHTEQQQKQLVSSNPETRKNLKEEEKHYVNRVYKPLLTEYEALENDFTTIKQQANRIDLLSQAHPSHHALLLKALGILQSDIQRHRRLHESISLEITNAYIHASVQNQQAIEEQFRTRAITLHKALSQARDALSLNMSKMGALLDDHLIKTRVHLSQLKKRKQQLVNLEFPPQVQTLLWDYLKHREEVEGSASIYDKVVWIKKTRVMAIGKRETLDLFKEKNRELEAPLIKTMKLWKEVENEAFDYSYGILYALEAQYLSEQLGMPSQHPNLRRLDRVLSEQVSAYEKKLHHTVEQVERSFNLPASSHKQ